MPRRSASSAPLATQAVADGRVSVVTALFRSLRPRQWTKNFLVFAGLVFGAKLHAPEAVASACLAFAVFCLLSGVVYLINDVRDQDADRLHPVKRHRPVASGALAPPAALAAAGIIAVVALGAAFWLSAAFFFVSALYVVALALYSTSLKHVVILDVLTLAFGFVLRAWAGAVAVDVRVSHWLLLMTLLLALFIGFSKRRAELATLGETASRHRRILADYSLPLLDQMITVVGGATLVAYALYTIDPQTVDRFHTDRLVWTFPFPLYGLFRYLYLVHQRAGGGDPSELLVTDGPLLACVGLWGVAVLAILYGPALTAAHPL